MNYSISENVIFTEGYKNAAIYDLKNKKVYSINHIAKDIINRLIVQGEPTQSKIEYDYIKSLITNGLYDSEYKVNEYKIDRQRDTKLNFAWLEITQACNLKCLHCYTGEMHKQSNSILPVDDWINILKQLFYAGCRNIQFIGGDPCIYPELIPLLDFAGTKGFDLVTVFTSATVLSEKIINCFSKNNINIRLSIYGHTAQIHDAITQINGSFERTVANIKQLLVQNIKVSPAVIIMRENQHCIEEIKTFIESLGLKYTGYDVIRNIFGGKQIHHSPTNETILNNSKRHKPEFYIDEETFKKAYLTNTCWYGKFAITETGTILPCVFERNIIIGDLRKQSIQEILDSEILKKYWLLTFDQIKICKDCEYKYACRDCRPLGIGICGDLFDKNPRCTYNPHVGEWKEGIDDN